MRNIVLRYIDLFGMPKFREFIEATYSGSTFVNKIPRG
jgi:hypothetical protein